MKINDATILIVDDEPDLREIFELILSNAGCLQVYTARDGNSALTVLRERHVDCLVTDIRMPGMDGITLVRRLIESSEHPPSIVFVSGFSDIDQREMYGLGVETFLSKPSSAEDLLAAVSGALAQRSELWQKSRFSPPHQSFSITLEGDQIDSFHLGRGGFSAPYTGVIALGKVAFQLSLPSEQRQIHGEGYVRWRSSSEGFIGIEFAFLEEPGRSWVVREIGNINPRAFIPSN